MEEDNAQQRKFKKMTETPVEPLICRMAVPTIISMLITSIYNMADTFFVGRIGTSATAAVGIVFSLMPLSRPLVFSLDRVLAIIFPENLAPGRWRRPHAWRQPGFSARF